MSWLRFIFMSEWPYAVQELFKAATVLLLLLWCMALWRRVGRSSPPAFARIASSLSLVSVAVTESAAGVLRLWPYVFGWPHNPMLLRGVYEEAKPVLVVAVCAAIAGLAGKGRMRWWVLLLALAAVFQWEMFRAGEPAMVVSQTRSGTVGPSELDARLSITGTASLALVSAPLVDANLPRSMGGEDRSMS